MQQDSSASPQPLNILLEIAPEDMQEPDPAAISLLARSIVSDLGQEGYTVTPVYTRQKGGIVLVFQVVMHIAQTVDTGILSHKDTLDILSDLCAIFGMTSPLVMHLFHGQEKELSKRAHEIKVSLLIDEAEIELTSSDLADDERILQLAERFLAKHPTARVKPNSSIKVRGRMLKKKPPRGR